MSKLPNEQSHRESDCLVADFDSGYDPLGGDFDLFGNDSEFLDIERCSKEETSSFIANRSFEALNSLLTIAIQPQPQTIILLESHIHTSIST